MRNLCSVCLSFRRKEKGKKKIVNVICNVEKKYINEFFVIRMEG